MYIANLRVKTENGEEQVEALELIQNLGIKGDKKAKGGDRQVCLADEKALTEYREKNIGLCTKRFMPNISTIGIDYSLLECGQKLTIGNVVIEISAYEKTCFPECTLVEAGTHCEILHNCAFGKIISGGPIHVGNEIVL